MNRYATFLAVVTLATGFAALRTTDDSPYEPIGLQEALTNEQTVKDVLTQYRAFKATFEGTIESLRRREIDLKEAHTIVTEASNRHYPKYLKLLCFSDKGATVDARLARNLVGHIRSVEEYHPTQPSPLPNLDQQLREVLAKFGE
jgi:hypothetical protein